MPNKESKKTKAADYEYLGYQRRNADTEYAGDNASNLGNQGNAGRTDTEYTADNALNQGNNIVRRDVDTEYAGGYGPWTRDLQTNRRNDADTEYAAETGDPTQNRESGAKAKPKGHC